MLAIEALTIKGDSNSDGAIAQRLGSSSHRLHKRLLVIPPLHSSIHSVSKHRSPDIQLSPELF